MNDRFDNFQVKVYEALRNAIFEAVYESQNTRSLIKIIQEHQMLEDLYEYMDTLGLRHIIEALALEQTQNKEAPKTEPSVKSEESDPPLLPGANQYIDGRKLTPNEKLFEEFSRARFCEENWLKRIKVKL